jgi:hypothetical protein
MEQDKNDNKKVHKTRKIVIIILICVAVIFAVPFAISEVTDMMTAPSDGTVGSDLIGDTGGINTEAAFQEPLSTYDVNVPFETPQAYDGKSVNANEVGEVMVIEFGDFIDDTSGASLQGSGDNSMTLSDFRNTLQQLYDDKFRPISAADYLMNKVTVAPGYIPIVFTFDGGLPGQFSITKNENGTSLKGNTAIGVLKDFHASHPDFEVAGTFYISLSKDVFAGDGTIKERLQYLDDLGLDIGNATYSGNNISQITSSETLQYEIGKNQSEVEKYITDYKMISISLPSGSNVKTDELKKVLLSGTYISGNAGDADVSYTNRGIFTLNQDLASSTIAKAFDRTSIPRVRASSFASINQDMKWQIANADRTTLYVCDGNPDVVSIPKNLKDLVNMAALDGQPLNAY